MTTQTKKKLLVYVLAGAMSNLLLLPTVDAVNQQSTTTVTTSNDATSNYELINVTTRDANAETIGVLASSALELFLTTPPTGNLHNIIAQYRSTDGASSVKGLTTTGGGE